MAHHLARCTPALTGEAAPVQSAIINAFSTSCCGCGPRQGQEQKLRVGATYYSEGRHAPKIRVWPQGWKEQLIPG